MLRGTGDPDDLVVGRATLDGFDTDAVTLPGVELLQALCEIRVDGRERSLPSGLLSGLFAKARPATLAADQVLFISGDEGDGCYRVDEGLLKVSVVAPAGGEPVATPTATRSVPEAEETA